MGICGSARRAEICCGIVTEFSRTSLRLKTFEGGVEVQLSLTAGVRGYLLKRTPPRA